MSEDSVFTPRAARYVAEVEARIKARAPREIAARIDELVSSHDAWRERSLNMNAAETLLSRRCRRVLDSDMATRLTEGLPGDKLYPHGVQNEHIDEIEATIIALARRQFGAKFIEWRSLGASMANAAVFFGMLQPGDTVLTQAEDNGGNYSYNRSGPAGLARLNIVGIPRRGAAFEIDLDQLDQQARALRPKMIVVGGSNILFPYPVRELRRIADRSGAILLYDAAHVALLIGAGDFQRPLEEGAHAVTFSTAKSIGGPVGGMLVTNDPRIASEVVRVTFPGLVQTRDENKYSALAIALAEVAEFGHITAPRMVANARALAAALEAEGFDVLARERGYTQTYQIFLNLGDTARTFETRCQSANILVSDCALAGDMELGRRTGARLATHELTRLGMGEAEMQQIARLIRRAARDGESAGVIASEVLALRERFPRLVYSFD